MTRNLIALPPILLPRPTACLAMSSVIPGTLRRRLLVVWGYTASERMLRLLLLSLSIGWQSGFGFGYGYGRKWAISFGHGFGYGHNWTSVTAPLSATADTRKTGFGQSLFLRKRVLLVARWCALYCLLSAFIICSLCKLFSWIQCESKKISPDFFWHFFSNSWEFLIQILHAYIRSYLW